MKRAPFLLLICCVLANAALAQQPAPSEAPASTPQTATTGAAAMPAPPPPDPTAGAQAEVAEPGAASSTPSTPADDTTTATPATMPSGTGEAPSSSGSITTPSPTDTQGAREVPLDSEPFDARVHRRVEEYGQRHQQRQRQMASYAEVRGNDPGLGRYADPRIVQVQLDDELDREQTSEELSGDYAEQTHDIQSKEQALQDFIGKRQQALDDLNKRNGSAAHRQDLEVALANLARQPLSPESLGEMRELDRRLSEIDHNLKDLPAQLTQNQQEATDAEAELAKLQGLRQSYEKESKTFTADALSARQNRLRLAGKLEYFIVRAQTEDTLEQGRKALESAHHLSASTEVESVLNGAGTSGKSDADLQQLRDCIRDSGDVKGCRQSMHQE
jgi:hypothetical protein